MAAHPLDPLSADEFRAVVSALRRDSGVTDSFRFAAIELLEPPKADVLSWTEGDSLPRQAQAVALGPGDEPHLRSASSTSAPTRCVSFDHVPGVQPNFTVDEWHECDDAMNANPDVIAALAARGITDLSLVLVDVWTYGSAAHAGAVPGPAPRLVRHLGPRRHPSGNPYAHPVAGLKLIVDMNTVELLEIEDDGVTPAARGDGRVRARAGAGPDAARRTSSRCTSPSPRASRSPSTATSCAGRAGRCGSASTTARARSSTRSPTTTTARRRPIAYRMSFAEMVVPYRDPTPDHYRRTAYDIGEWGLGFMTTSLELGCDCLGEIRYVDAVLTDSRGEPFTITNAICLHEEDNAVLWKHVDGDTGAEVRRMRRLVVSCHATVANYEYLVYWRFYQDGNIECEVRATGIMVTTPFAEGADPPPYGHCRRPPDVCAVPPALPGRPSSTSTSTAPTTPCSRSTPRRRRLGPTTRTGWPAHARPPPLRRESEAGRDFSWDTQRAWKVVNPDRHNGIGDPVAYKLVPSGAFPAMMDPSTPQYLSGRRSSAHRSG